VCAWSLFCARCMAEAGSNRSCILYVVLYHTGRMYESFISGVLYGFFYLSGCSYVITFL